MGDMADYFNELHEIEEEEWYDLQYADGQTRYEAGHVDESGWETQTPGRRYPSGSPARSSGPVDRPFVPDPLYYHMTLTDCSLAAETEKSYLVNCGGKAKLWVPKKICKNVDWEHGTLMVHHPTFKKILEKYHEDTNKPRC
jgi:hypothetical protein